MKTLFDRAVVEDVKARVRTVRPDSVRQWGKMSATQAIAHCAKGMEMAVGDLRPPRVFIGRIFGPLVKPLAIGNDKPMKRNAPTAPELVVSGEPDLDVERERLCALIDRFATGGPARCTTHPHAFFGRLTPEQWADLMHKHLDHHLRQFGA
jgi:uncharacterized protein DUF1569